MLMVARGKRRYVSLLLFLSPLVSFAEPRPPPPIQVHAPEEDPTWERLEEKDGVTIFLRERREGGIKEVMGKGVIDAPPCRVFQIIRDSDRLAEFMPYLKAHIVKRAGTDWEYACEYLDFPWPIWDRFVHVRIDAIRNYGKNPCEYFVYWRKDETYSCTVAELKKTYQGAMPDPVVPLANEGYWHLIPRQEGRKTLAHYYVFTDPGGRIPNWMINLFVDDAVLKLFRAVRERVRSSLPYPPCPCRSSTGP
jgi:hypothetical protein